MKLVDIIQPELVTVDLTSAGKMDVLAELGALLAKHGQGVEEKAVTKVLVERERLATTGIGKGVAIPHGKIEGLKGILATIGISRTGVQFDAVDSEPVHILFALLAPLGSSGDHLRALARISRLLKDPEIRSRLLEAETAQKLFEVICEEDGKY